MITPVKKLFLPFVVGCGKVVEKVKFSQSPVIIGGCGRSGTTLLLSILSSHENIFACPRELNLFNSNPTRIDRIYTFLLSHRIPHKATRWCEKTPRSIRHIAEIEDYFDGRVNYIQIVRDGRDVILSKHPKKPNEYWVSPERWVSDVSIGLSHINKPFVFTVKYEDLILDHETTIAKICSFLKIPVTEQILNWHTFATIRKNEAYHSEVRTLSNRSIGKWRRPEYKTRVNELLNIPRAKELLQYFDYLE